MLGGMKKTIFAVVALLSGCATTFNLGTVHPQAGRTADQQQLDTLTCKDQAHLSVESGAQQAKEFWLGFSIVGYPAAIAIDRAKQRAIFTECMQAKGYSVSPAT